MGLQPGHAGLQPGCMGLQAEGVRRGVTEAAGTSPSASSYFAPPRPCSAAMTVSRRGTSSLRLTATCLGACAYLSAKDCGVSGALSASAATAFFVAVAAGLAAGLVAGLAAGLAASSAAGLSACLAERNLPHAPQLLQSRAQMPPAQSLMLSLFPPSICCVTR